MVTFEFSWGERLVRVTVSREKTREASIEAARKKLKVLHGIVVPAHAKIIEVVN